MEEKYEKLLDKMEAIEREMDCHDFCCLYRGKEITDINEIRRLIRNEEVTEVIAIFRKYLLINKINQSGEISTIHKLNNIPNDREWDNQRIYYINEGEVDVPDFMRRPPNNKYRKESISELKEQINNDYGKLLKELNKCKSKIKHKNKKIQRLNGSIKYKIFKMLNLSKMIIRHEQYIDRIREELEEQNNEIKNNFGNEEKAIRKKYIRQRYSTDGEIKELINYYSLKVKKALDDIDYLCTSNLMGDKASESSGSNDSRRFRDECKVKGETEFKPNEQNASKVQTMIRGYRE